MSTIRRRHSEEYPSERFVEKHMRVWFEKEHFESASDMAEALLKDRNGHTVEPETRRLLEEMNREMGGPFDGVPVTVESAREMFAFYLERLDKTGD